MSEATEVPSASPEDAFGPPHSQQVSDSLQMWILIPGLLILAVAGEHRALAGEKQFWSDCSAHVYITSLPLLLTGYLIFRLISSQREKTRKREEKKRLKQERREKKKGK